MNDFSELNHLPTDLKLLVVKGQTLVNDAKQKMNDRAYGFDLTSKWELKADCKQVEKCIRLICKGKITDKNVRQLEHAIIHLETILNGLVSFFTRE